MTDQFTKENDYTLTQLRVIKNQETSPVNTNEKIYIKAEIQREFNFLAAQVTTRTLIWSYQSRGQSAGGSSSVSSNTQIENFDDIQSAAEIKFMHAKLIELEGKPPALEEIFKPDSAKKPTFSAVRKNEC